MPGFADNDAIGYVKCILCQAVFEEAQKRHFQGVSLDELRNSMFDYCYEIRPLTDVCISFVSQHLDVNIVALNVHPKAACESSVRVCYKNNMIRDIFAMRESVQETYYVKQRISILHIPKDGEPMSRDSKCYFITVHLFHSEIPTLSISMATLKAEMESREDALKFMAKLGLIANSMKCPELTCDQDMSLVKDNSELDGFVVGLKKLYSVHIA